MLLYQHVVILKDQLDKIQEKYLPKNNNNHRIIQSNSNEIEIG